MRREGNVCATGAPSQYQFMAAERFFDVEWQTITLMKEMNTNRGDRGSSNDSTMSNLRDTNVHSHGATSGC